MKIQILVYIMNTKNYQLTPINNGTANANRNKKYF